MLSCRPASHAADGFHPRDSDTARARIGNGLWNFRGTFGILDSGRLDAAYENWHSYRLDRRLLELMQEF